jgi:signal transduction histidine kinase
LDGFSQRSGITTTFNVPTQFDRLERDVELTLFRILQEALTNVHRHSGSTTAAVRLERTGSEIVLEVSDQGTGISVEVLEKSGPGWVRSLGVGLRGMNERLRQFGGNLDIQSSEQGTTVRARIPVDLGMSGSEHKGGEGANSDSDGWRQGYENSHRR